MKAEELLDQLANQGVSFRMNEGRLEVKDLDKLDKELRELLKNTEPGIIRYMYEQRPGMMIQDLPKPYLTGAGELVIPMGCHLRYKYWQRGCKSTWQPVNDSLSLKEILLELRASEEVMRRYIAQ